MQMFKSAIMIIAFLSGFLKHCSHFPRQWNKSMRKNLVLNILISHFFLFFGPNRQLAH